MLPDPSAAAVKRQLRQRFRAARLALSDEQYEAASGVICARLAEEEALRKAAVISVYWPMLVRREVDTRSLIAALVASGRQVVLPAIDPAGDRPALRHVAFTGEDALRASRWGLLEPVGPSVPAGTIGAVVVPALGAGRNGHRIGHGKGYYDAFLSLLDAPTLGAVFADCLVDHVPAEPHDVALGTIITERETVRPSP